MALIRFSCIDLRQYSFAPLSIPDKQIGHLNNFEGLTILLNGTYLLLRIRHLFILVAVIVCFTSLQTVYHLFVDLIFHSPYSSLPYLPHSYIPIIFLITQSDSFLVINRIACAFLNGIW